MAQDEIDSVVEKLSNKECPLHNRQMVETTPFLAGSDYRRDRYKCSVCGCKVAFVDGEMKMDTVCYTLVYVNTCGGVFGQQDPVVWL